MNTEEKARAYDEALKRAKQVLSNNCTEVEKLCLECIFPELTESEDERIRKEAISIVQSYMNICDKEGDPCLSGYQVLAWLEEQKEPENISASTMAPSCWELEQKEQKPVEPIEFDNEFENQVSHLLASVLNGEHEYNEGFVKYAAQSLLGYAKNELKGAEQNIAEMSDDDRIRNWIKKEIVNKYVEDGIVNSKLADDALGWLEKQKHLYETTKDRFYREGFEEGQLYERRKEPAPIPDKFSGLKSLMLQYLQSAANHKDDAEIEDDTDLFGRKILDYVWKYDGTQKEQNSSALQDAFDRSVKDYSLEEKRQASDYAESILPTSITYGESKDEYKLHKIIEAAYIAGQKEQKPYEPRNWPADKDNLTQEQKPAEWDDYTKTNLDRALQIIKDAKGKLQGYQSDDGIYECDKAIECLEHFLYRGLEIEKPAEWSEEDKQMMDYFERLLEYAYNNDPHNLGKCCVAGKMWLKSLRPQSQWKPSEEQIKWLKDVIETVPMTCRQQVPLESLYEQLKKLM